MTDNRIIPERVTKPFQLLAAWLTGLIIVDASFLTAASQIHYPDWAAGFLVVAAILNVPLFLTSIFLLQTKFRPQMQTDEYYSKYLEFEYSEKKSEPKKVNPKKETKKLARSIMKELATNKPAEISKVEDILELAEIERLEERFGDTRTLSELFLFPEKWEEIVLIYGGSKHLHQEIDTLIAEGFIIMDKNNPFICKLTDLGRRVAELAQKRNRLWNLHNDRQKLHENSLVAKAFKNLRREAS